MKPELIIIGAGGHAKVVIDMLKKNDEYSILGCIGNGNSTKNILDIPIIGDDTLLPDLRNRGIVFAFVAIGDNQIRKKLSLSLKQLGFKLINSISQEAYIASGVSIGEGVAIMPGAIINADTVIADNVIVNTGATIDHDCIIQSYVHIAPGCNLAGNVAVGEGAFLGIGAKVIPHVQIGAWSILGAGAVATKAIPPEITAIGIPARIKKKNL